MRRHGRRVGCGELAYRCCNHVAGALSTCDSVEHSINENCVFTTRLLRRVVESHDGSFHDVLEPRLVRRFVGGEAPDETNSVAVGVFAASAAYPPPAPRHLPDRGTCPLGRARTPCHPTPAVHHRREMPPQRISIRPPLRGFASHQLHLRPLFGDDLLELPIRDGVPPSGISRAMVRRRTVGLRMVSISPDSRDGLGR